MRERKNLSWLLRSSWTNCLSTNVSSKSTKNWTLLCHVTHSKPWDQQQLTAKFADSVYWGSFQKEKLLIWFFIPIFNDIDLDPFLRICDFARLERLALVLPPVQHNWKSFRKLNSRDNFKTFSYVSFLLKRRLGAFILHSKAFYRHSRL